MAIEQNRPRVTELYPGNVTHLYKTPLYLYPNNSYTVAMNIEQDPVKVFPVFDMTTEEQRAIWASLHGASPEHILPYLLQCRAPWILNQRITPSKYKPYLGWDALPDAQYYILQGGFRDLWYAERAFRVRCDVYSGEDLLLSIDTAIGGLGAIVWHTGHHGWSAFVGGGDIDFSDYPCDAAHAFTAASGGGNGFIFEPGKRGLGNRRWSGGNEWVGFAASVDGNGKFSIVCIGAGKDIRLSCTVNQTAVDVPNGWGQNTNVAANYYATEPDPVAPYLAGDLINSCRNKLGVLTYGQNHGWDTAAETALSMLIGSPPQTVYTGSSTYNPPGDGYDFTALGDPGPEYWALSCYGKYKEDHHNLTLGSHSYEYNLLAASPLAVGADKTLIDGSFDAMASITGGNAFSADEAAVDAKIAIVDNWQALINGRKQYNKLYQQPRIKITLSATAMDEAANVVVVDYSKVLYCDLPGLWESWPTQQVFNDWITFSHAAADFWTNGTTSALTKMVRESTDFFTKGEYGAGEMSFGVSLNFEGLLFNKFITGSTNLGEIYEGEDDYIYDETNPQTYSAWLTAQGL